MAKYKDQLQEFKTSNFFPQKSIPKDFAALVKKAMASVSPAVLQMTWPDFKALKNRTDKKYNLLDMGTALWIFQQRSQRELGLTDEEYDLANDMLLKMMQEWQDIINKKEKRLENMLETEFINAYSQEEKAKSREIPLAMPSEQPAAEC
jgi:hypothetical protein